MLVNNVTHRPGKVPPRETTMLAQGVQEDGCCQGMCTGPRFAQI